MIAGLDAIEAAGAVGDDAGEHVEPAGRAFRIGGGRDVARQREAFEQRHDVDAVGFQHRAVGQRELVQLEFVDALGDRGLRPGQKARADAIGHLAEPQVEARRLNLIGREFAHGTNPTALRERGDHVIGQDALVSRWSGGRNRLVRLRRSFDALRRFDLARQVP